MLQPLQRISEAERRFLADGVAEGLRADGRGCFDYRRVHFELGSVPSATSSCRLRAGETDLIVGIKAEMSTPPPDSSDEGHVQVAVDCAASVSRALAESFTAQEWARQLSTLLESLCVGQDVIDRRALCVLPGVFAWEVFIDVLVLASGGNLLDSISLALCVALRQTLLPKVSVLEPVEEGEKQQLQVDERPEVGTPFPLRKVPLCVTVVQLQGRCLLDVTCEEELCAEAMLCVVVDVEGRTVIGMHKMGKGLFDVALIPSMLDRCCATAESLLKQVAKELPAPLAQAVSQSQADGES